MTRADSFFQNPPANILVRGVDTVGTFVLASPFYRELRKNLPSSRITLCVKPLVRELAQNCPYADEIIIYDKKKYGGETGFIKELRKRKFGAVFVLSGSFHSALACRLAGIKERIGYPHDGRGFLLNRRIADNDKHCVEYLLNIIAQLGGKAQSNELEMWFSAGDFSRGKEMLESSGIRGNDRFIGIGFGAAGEPARTWATENWITLIRELLKDGKYKVVLFGSKKDEAEAAVMENAVSSSGLVNLVNKTNTVKLAEFAACVRKSSLYISVNTGGMHMAAALGVKTLGLFNPGNDDRWGPRGKDIKIISKDVPCAPCDQSKMRRCRDNKCMKSITPEETAALCRSLLSGEGEQS